MATKVQDPKDVEHGQQNTSRGTTQVSGGVGVVDQVVGGVCGIQESHRQEAHKSELV